MTNPYAAPEATLEPPGEWEPEGPPALPDAPRGLRLVALAIDALVVLGQLIAQRWLSIPDRYFGGLPAQTGVLLELALTAASGRSIGKWVVRLAVVRVADDSPATFTRAFLLRTLIPLVLFSMAGVWSPLFVLSDLLPLFREDRRCLHDHLAGTRVVRAADVRRFRRPGPLMDRLTAQPDQSRISE